MGRDLYVEVDGPYEDTEVVEDAWAVEWVDALISELREDHKRRPQPQQEFTRAGLPSPGPTETADRARTEARPQLRAA